MLLINKYTGLAQRKRGKPPTSNHSKEKGRTICYRFKYLYEVITTFYIYIACANYTLWRKVPYPYNPSSFGIHNTDVHYIMDTNLIVICVPHKLNVH